MRNLVKKNILKLKPSSTLVINEKCKDLISQGKKVYQLGFGQSPFPVPEKIVSELKKNAHKKEYLPIQGLPALREAVSNYLLKKTGVNYPKENILITPGSKEAMLLMHVAFNGEIILPAPSWVSYEPQAQIGLNKIHWLQTTRENNWFPTPKEIEKKIQKIGKNKNIILILNSPNNPSGTVCKNLKKIAIIAEKYKIIILSDEIYTDLTFCNRYESISKFYPEATFVSGGLSKWCGAGGWRLGFFAVPKKLSGFLENLKSLAIARITSLSDIPNLADRKPSITFHSFVRSLVLSPLFLAVSGFSRFFKGACDSADKVKINKLKRKTDKPNQPVLRINM